MDIRNLDESLPHDMSGPVVIVLYQAGLLSPPGAHHRPQDRRLPPHPGWQPQPHTDRQRKLSYVASSESI